METIEFKKIPKKQEIGLEKETFEPQIIFDLIRHAEAEYGPKLKEKFEKLGYDWEKLMTSSKITEGKIKSPADMEGRATIEGERCLREVISKLVEKIDKDNEIIMVLFGPRFRTADSGRIILEELEKRKVNVYKAREHKNLIDMKKHWISILEFVNNRTEDKESPFQYWLNMSEQELNEADLEGLEDVGKRLNSLIKIIERYVQIYKNKLGDKKLRVIAITHDMNILSALKKEKGTQKEVESIKNSQIVELGVNKEGDRRLLIEE